MPTCDLAIRVVPRASHAGITGRRGDAILVRVGAAPVDGAANAELIETLARALRVPGRSLSLVAGGSARCNRVRVEGLTCDEALRRLGLS